MSHGMTPITAFNVAALYPELFPHAVKAGGMVFCSGTIGMDSNCKIAEGGIQDHTFESLLIKTA